jgi:hypothetical protein
MTLRIEYERNRKPFWGKPLIPDVLQLSYDPNTPPFWGCSAWSEELQCTDIFVYGNVEAPQVERFPTVQLVVEFLGEIHLRAQIDLHNHFNRWAGPLDDISLTDISDAQFRQLFWNNIDDLDVWNLDAIWFGVTGDEPVNEFRLQCWDGIWDATPHYVWYQLNNEHPAQSTLIRFGGGRTGR